MTEQEISLKKKLYDEETEDIFDRSYVRILKKLGEINGGCLYFVKLWSAEPSKAFCLRNLVCYSKIYVGMLLG